MHGGHVQGRVARRSGLEEERASLSSRGKSLKYVKRRQLEKMGRHATDTTELFFDDCPVPVGNLLGEEGMGFKYTMQKFNQERLEVCIKSPDLRGGMLQGGPQYAKVREAFGKPIGNFEHISFELAEMATEVEIGITFLHTCVEEFIRGEDITKKVSMAKAWICEMVKQGRLQSRPDPRGIRLHGGIPHMPALSGRPRAAHLRGHDRDHEGHHRAAARSEAGVLGPVLFGRRMHV